MITEPFSSVWDAIEDAPELRENLKVRSVLMMELKGYMERTGLSQSQAASLFGVTQPRVSDLVRGKIDLFSSKQNDNLFVGWKRVPFWCIRRYDGPP